MKSPLIGILFAAAALLTMPLFTQFAAGDEMPGYKSPTGPAPRMASGKPDFSGVWQPPRMADVTKNERCCKGVPELPYSDWGRKNWEDYHEGAQGDYAGSCLPFGQLRSVGGPHPVQIIQNDKYIAFLWEQNTWFHVTPLDGRPHKKDAEPTWFGDSVGHWEGDTLVIDTVNFNGKTRVDTIGHPVSDRLHTVERYTRKDLGNIDYVLTIDDPKAYSKPWDSIRQWHLHPEWELMEYSCEENNKDLFEHHIKAGPTPLIP